MATLQQIRDAVDARLATLWASIQTRQAAYLAAHGRYWQGLRTHAVPPADGAEVPPDVGAKVPTDQPDPWPAAMVAGTMPMSLQIDVYDGPAGKGYAGTVLVMVVGTPWTRSVQVGPEGWRVQPWVRAI